MALMIWSFFTGINWILTPTKKHLYLHVLAVSVMCSVRIIGVVVVPVILCGHLLDMYLVPKPNLKERLLDLLKWLVLSLCLTVFLLPIFWESSLPTLWNAVRHFSKYPWSGTVLYQGAFVPSTQLPWHYLFVWMGITSPLYHLVFACLGVLVMIKDLLMWTKEQFYRYIPFILSGIMLLGVLGAVLLFDPVLYDGWRHFFFLYPSFLLFVVLGMYMMYRWLDVNGGRYWFWGILAVVFGLTIIRMGVLHPYQHVYFNAFAGDPSTIRMRYEQDYWGTVYKSLLETVLEKDDRPVIRIAVSTDPGYFNLDILREDQKRRVTFVRNAAEADYFLTNFRWHPHLYIEKAIYYGQRRGMILGAIYQLSH